jgi:hypothetical protein
VTAFAEACQQPFANGTEGEAWEACWCAYCAHDHQAHIDNYEDGCSLLAISLLDEWPEGWIPDPDDGRSFLPSRLICTAFQPCDDCGGDPGAEERAVRVAEVTAYWRDRDSRS